MSFLKTLLGLSPLGGLNTLDDRALRDLGINRYDLFEAAHKGRKAGAFLAERRCETACAATR